jgi:hypothetical protein
MPLSGQGSSGSATNARVRRISLNFLLLLANFALVLAR